MNRKIIPCIECGEPTPASLPICNMCQSFAQTCDLETHRLDPIISNEKLLPLLLAARKLIEAWDAAHRYPDTAMEITAIDGRVDDLQKVCQGIVPTPPKYPPKLQSRWKHAEAAHPHGYTVIAITNTAHLSDRHPPHVVYKGDNGNIWSMAVSEWPGKLVKMQDQSTGPTVT